MKNKESKLLKYPLSSYQKDVWLEQRLYPGKPIYNIGGYIEIQGELDCNILAEAFESVVENNPIMQVVIKQENELDYQEIVAITNCLLPVYDFSECKNAKQFSLDWINKEFIKPFGFNEHLFQFALLKVSQHHYLVFGKTHHLIMDGWGYSVFVRQLLKRYRRLVSGVIDAEVTPSYIEFISEDIEYMKSVNHQKDVDFWRSKFQETPDPLFNLKFNAGGLGDGADISGRKTLTIKRNLYNQMNSWCKARGYSAFHLFLGILFICSHKISGQNQIGIGVPILNRTTEKCKRMIGHFANTLPLKISAGSQTVFTELLTCIKNELRECYRHQKLPYGEIYRTVLGNSPDKRHLFEIILSYEKGDFETEITNDWKSRVVTLSHRNERNALSVYVREFSKIEDVDINFDYRFEFFNQYFPIESIITYFQTVLDEVLNNSNLKICEIDILSLKEKEQILYNFNNTQVEYPKDKTIHQLFEEQVEKTPDTIAVMFEDQQLTYREINEKANQLARTLRDRGVGPDTIVAIMVERSPEMIVGILGILKAGGAYLPIDPEYPEDRIRFMLADSQTEIILTKNYIKEKYDFGQIVIDVDNKGMYAVQSGNLKTVNQPDNLAYIIYTSGSTGHPKGVLIEQKSIVDRLQWRKAEYQLNSEDKVLILVAYTFDAFVTTLFTPMISGAGVQFISENESKNVIAIKERLIRNQITHFSSVPTLYLALLAILNKNEAQYLKIVTLGGEKVTSDIIKKTKEISSSLEVMIEYGPTECAVVSAFCRNPQPDTAIIIGKPIANTQIYIVDQNTQILPIGIPGELCIAGKGLARGYLNRPELTAEKFVENPFKSGEMMYRTGDLARWLPDGNIEFLGRLDHQVKIRGFRIELGEIESRLLKHPLVKETVAVAKEDSQGGKYLCAYLVGEAELTTVELREHLAKELPDYMIPSYFIPLEKLPLTPNGKIDRKALPEPDGSIHTGVEYVAPVTETETKLVSLWQGILGVDRVGVKDNFFELGGHSLRATTLVSGIHKEFNVELPLREVFKAPTLAEMARYIQDARESMYSDIEPVEEREYYPLSSAQRRLYILEQFEGVSTAYNMPAVMIIEGELDKARLEAAFRGLITRHETLRTSFAMVDGEPAQQVDREVDFNITYLEATAAEAGELAEGFIRPFDLKAAPLLRVCLIKTGAERHLMLYDMHHIIADGVSINLLAQELISLYEGKELPGLRIQYKDYAVWQKGLYAGELINKQEEYWRETFRGEIPPLNLPLDYPRPAIQSFAGDSIHFEIKKGLAEKLNQVAKAGGATLYMIMLAALNTLLSKYTRQEEIVIGSPIAGRPHADLQNMIGMFVNTLAMRNYPEGEKTFREFLREVRDNALKAYENQDYPFEELVEKLDIQRDLSRNPLFDVMFALQNMDMTEIVMAGLKFRPYESPFRIAKFDLTFNAMETGAGIACDIEYGSKLFKRETIARLIGHYLNILAQVTENPNIRLKAIEILTKEERNRILYDCNRTRAEYPKEKTIHQLFEEQVEKRPDKTAVVFADKQLTYSELNEKANQLARVLRENGVGPDGIVAIMMERSVEMIVGIMGVLKAGGAYLPIDPEYPEDRIKYMLENSGTGVLLIQNSKSEARTFPGITIDISEAKLSKMATANPDPASTPRNLAYIIYTSGTTGKPKGVMIEHANVVGLMFNEQMQFDFDQNDVWTMFHSFCFDFSVWEMYGALLYGGKLVVVPKLTAQNTREYLRLLKEEKVTVLNQTPTAFYHLVAEAKRESSELGIRYVIFGGEALKPKMLQEWRSRYPKAKLINMYGITETTVHVTYKEITEEEIEFNISNIGKPIPTLTTYIMDRNMKLLPVGVAGELCVGGDGVGRGYLNNIELTREKFVPNPYKTEERLYKSGDLARMLPSGDLEYLGRIDHQVKIRGFRIELGEIESRLLKHPLVKATVVVAKEDSQGGKYLCAYLVGEAELTTVELREHLAKELPDYMIPSYFIPLEKLPLTSNGKIDRQALPEPDGSIHTGVEYVAPVTKTEEKLALVWQDILGIENVGTRDNFFELGGHSLKATTLVSRIAKEFNVQIPLRDIFQHPTIKELGEYILKAEKGHYAEIKPIAKKSYYPVSSAQKRLYILNQFGSAGVGYNMPEAIVIEGKLEREHLEMAFQKLIWRHETLRTSFEMINGEPVQRIHEQVEFALDYREGDEAEAEAALQCFIQPFDLSQAPLFRVGLIKVSQNKHILLVDIHHIIADGVSEKILIRELIKLYQGETLPELRIQYKDFSVWQNELLKSKAIVQQEMYWLKTFSGEIPVLNLPSDYPKLHNQNFGGDSLRIKIEKELTKQLYQLADACSTTLFMVLFAAFNVLLSKWIGQEEIVVGVPIAGRRCADLESIVGVFVNMLAIRSYPILEKTFVQFLKEIKVNLLEAYDNQDYQFEMLLDKINLSRRLNGTPLFNVVFNMLNMGEGSIEAIAGNFTVKPYKFKPKISKYDLELYVSEENNELVFNYVYSAGLFEKNSIEKLSARFIRILSEIVINSDIMLLSLFLEEKSSLIQNFNEELANEL
jgi:amino acid adenylation domain-containing protein